MIETQMLTGVCQVFIIFLQTSCIHTNFLLMSCSLLKEVYFLHRFLEEEAITRERDSLRESRSRDLFSVTHVSHTLALASSRD